MMNRACTLLTFLACFVTLTKAAPSIRMPQMPAPPSGNQKARSSKQRRPSVQKPPRKKRKGLTGRKEYHTISNMTYEELKDAKNKNKESNPMVAIKYLEKMIKLGENINEKAPLTIEERAQLTLELADIYFSQEDYVAAKKWYQEFDRFYQGNKQIEYIKRQIILCAKQGILSFDRDQAATEETLQLAEESLTRDSFTLYRKEIEAIKKECEALLVQSECGVTQFYIKQGNYDSADRRIKHIRTAWLEKVPEATLSVAHLEIDLGIEWKDFKVPEESLKLVHATIDQSSPKTSMTTRF